MAHAGHRHMMLLHGLQQRRLGARAGAVDLVGHQQLAEDRTRHEAELAAALFGFVENFGTQNIGRHQVGRELDALFIEAQYAAELGGELGLGKTRRADEKGMAAGQNGGERQFDDFGLAEDHLADRVAHFFEAFAGGFEFLNDFLVRFVDACHGPHYSLLVPLIWQRTMNCR